MHGTETMVSVKEVGERTLVSNIKSIIGPRSGNTVIGPGDDAAVVKSIKDGTVVISTDVVTKARHFPETMTYEQFGWTAAAVNFSDIASMGARPLGFLPAITVPEDEDESDLYDIVSGIDQCCEFCNADVVGGDTKFGELAVAGTAFGTMDGRAPMTRSGARPGDIVAVTGTLGDAAAGYYALKNGIEGEDQIFSLMVPVPHVEDGIRMSGTGIVHSCMDLSDGLAASAREICARSGVGMALEWEFLPMDDRTEEILSASKVDLMDTVTRWGGEYELLFTFSKEDIQKLYDTEVAFSIIGTVTDGNLPYITAGDRRTEMSDGVY